MKICADTDELYPVLEIYTDIDEDETGVYDVPDNIVLAFRKARKEFKDAQTTLLNAINEAGGNYVDPASWDPQDDE